jgi:hypothetical protein
MAIKHGETKMSDDVISAPLWVYHLWRGIITDEQFADYNEIDLMMTEVLEELQGEFLGEGREFYVELDSFDEDTWTVEIITGFTWFFLEDDEADMDIIIEEIEKQLANVGIEVDEVQILYDPTGEAKALA